MLFLVNNLHEKSISEFNNKFLYSALNESHDGRNLAARAYCNLHSCYNFAFVLHVKIYSFLTNQVRHIEEM